MLIVQGSRQESGKISSRSVFVFLAARSYQDEYHLGGIILLSGVKSSSGLLGFFVTPGARTVDISSKWGTKRGNVIL